MADYPRSAQKTKGTEAENAYGIAQSTLYLTSTPFPESQNAGDEARVSELLEGRQTGKRLQEQYLASLSDERLLLPTDRELNWSGRGQHVTFGRDEKLPLQVIANIGHGTFGSVDRVLCRRIALARKAIKVRPAKLKESVQEVAHLQRLRRFHIVQLVGTYLQGPSLIILMYPVAGCDLQNNFEETTSISDTSRLSFLASTLGCLSSALRYLHINMTNYLDIKPASILIRRFETDAKLWRVYLVDFGISPIWITPANNLTIGSWYITPRYGAPGASSYVHSPASDIFSLGCAYVEILSVCAGHALADLKIFLFKEERECYFEAYWKVMTGIDDYLHNNTRGRDLDDVNVLLGNLKRTFDMDKESRPTARELRRLFASLPPMSPFGAL